MKKLMIAPIITVIMAVILCGCVQNAPESEIECMLNGTITVNETEFTVSSEEESGNICIYLTYGNMKPIKYSFCADKLEVSYDDLKHEIPSNYANITPVPARLNKIISALKNSESVVYEKYADGSYHFTMTSDGAKVTGVISKKCVLESISIPELSIFYNIAT